MAKTTKTGRQVAHRVLDRVMRKGAYASLALSAELDRAGLEPREAGLATELVYGVLTHQLRLDRALEAASDRGIGRLDPWSLMVLRTAAYQLLFLRIPAYAATNEAVSTLRRLRGDKMAGLGNAILRRLVSQGEPPLPSDPTEALLVEHSVPAWLYRALVASQGEEVAGKLVKTLSRPAGQGLRISPGVDREELLAELRQRAPATRFVPCRQVPSAVVAFGAGALHKTRPYLEGRFSLQDPAAQAAALLLDPQPGETILDACAGIGGKSTHMASLMSDRGHIDAVDKSVRKLSLLEEQTRRLKLRSIHPLAHEVGASWPQAIGAQRYDRVLIDAPCSGLGVLRRHPELKWRLRPEEIAPLVESQRKLLDAVSSRLKPGGVLVYAICTWTAEEGPGVVGRFLSDHPAFELESSRSLLWDSDETDGFFLARLKHRGGSC